MRIDALNSAFYLAKTSSKFWSVPFLALSLCEYKNEKKQLSTTTFYNWIRCVAHDHILYY